MHGSATITRIDGATTDTLIVTLTTVEQFREAHLCVSTTAYTSRTSPGQCQYSLGAGTTGQLTIQIDADDPVYLQIHAVVGGETGYVGWEEGNPFYGNVEVPDTAPDPVAPFECADGSEMSADLNGDGVVDQDDCEYVAPFECADGSDMSADLNGDGVVDQDDCDFVAPFECADGSDMSADLNGDGVIDQDDCDYEPIVFCDDAPTVVDDGVDGNGDGVSDACQVFCPGTDVLVDDMPGGVCTTPFVPTIPVVDTCPDGSTMVDTNGDGLVTAADCTQVLPDGGVLPTPTPVTPAEPAAPAVPATPAAPAVPAPSVLPDVVTPDVVPVVAAAPAPAAADSSAVLGAQVQRAPLARTGSSSTGLAAFGALLVLLGATATVAGRRTART